jgi:hypothetical protein
MPNRSRWWRFKYRFANKEKRLSLGVYPEIPIADARERLDKARRLLYEGIDPSAQRKAAKAAALLGSGSTFEIIACEWFAMNSPRWVTGHSEKELGPATGHPRYVFPGEYHRRRPMSENTVNAALRRLGYTSDQMTGHGFRSMASTLLNEQGWDTEAIERQLAHVEGNSVKAAYNYAQHLPVRRKMMQAWADYLDSLSDPGLRRARELLNREINSTVYTPAEVKPRGSQRSIAQASDTDSSKQPRCDSHGRSQQNEPQRTFGETHEIHFHMLIKVASSGAHGPPSAFSPSAAI